MRRPRPTLLSLPLLLLTLLVARADVALIAPGSTWSYRDLGTLPAANWQQPEYDASGWSTGPAQLGYGDGDEATLVGFGPSATSRYITTYFRHAFTVADPSELLSLRLRLIRDDGVVVFLNGVEIKRDNLPAGAVSTSTLASSSLGAPAESSWIEFSLPASGLVAGANLLAIELHQGAASSSDLSLDVELIGVTSLSVVRGPYLQMAAPTAMTVRWRTSAATDSRVRVGPAAGVFAREFSVPGARTEHEVALTGLSASTAYFYAVGDAGGDLAGGDAGHVFYTAPVAGTPQASRFWVIGDAGTGTTGQAAVRDAYAAYAGNAYTDLVIALGDNAYDAGTDAEYQAKFFNVYSSLLRRTALFSTVGNHETAQSANPSLSIPYFQNFTFPTAGECGGVPSGTEKYYSFDYANVHFICLDSMSSSLSATGAMAAWLQADLAATVQGWIVAFFHHPPYTKGSHDSDVEANHIAIRQNLLPILEAGGVDLILSGHSHAYERSRLVRGHYGLSPTFNPTTMQPDGGDGDEAGDGAYIKPAGLSANQGAVFVVAGNGGKATYWDGGSTADTNPNPHVVMQASLLRRGSVVLDVTGDRLDVRMLRETGDIDDHFTLRKQIPNTPPSVALVSPVEGTSVQAPGTLVLEAAVSDAEGSVVQVDFYADGAPLGTDLTPPFALTWTDIPEGVYALSAVALDDRGATTQSEPVPVTVGPAVPSVPDGLAAAGGPGEISLTWSTSAGAAAYTVYRSLGGAAPELRMAGLTVPSFTDGPVSPGVSACYTVVANGPGGTSAASAPACATALAYPRPNAPTGLAVTSVQSTAVGLQWTDASADETAFVVYLSTNKLTWSPVATLSANSTSATINDLTPGETCYFRVRSYNPTGGYSAYTAGVVARLLPKTPTGLSVAAVPGQLSLSWAPAAGALSYSVHRSVNGGAFALLASGLTTTAHADTGVVVGSTYCYAVSAVSAGGEGPRSAAACATAPAYPRPNAPTGLSVTSVQPTSVDLVWADTSSDETRFAVYQSTNRLTWTIVSVLDPNTTATTIGGLAPGVAYYYRVRSYTPTGGYSAYSNSVIAITPSGP